MKHKLIIFCLLMMTVSLSRAQDFVGSWRGTLDIQGTKLRVVFNITEQNNAYIVTMDSPDQNAIGIQTSTAVFEDGTMTITIKTINLEYKGTLKGKEIVGVFKQGGLELPLTLVHSPLVRNDLSRPQEPKPPFPYYEEEVRFMNEQAAISFGGTLTLPSKEGRFPAVILITGSGAQDRNEEAFGHKPFLVIADYLTRNGIAVLRIDDRGVGASEGSFENVTTFDFVTDIESALRYLKTRKEIDKTQIGLIGHSEGGVIAPIVASQSKDIRFIVMLAGMGVRGDKLLLSQQKAIAVASGVSEKEIADSQKINKQAMDLIITESTPERLHAQLSALLNDYFGKHNTEIPNGMSQDEFIEMQVEQITAPWMVAFLRLDPAPYLEKVKCPVLAVNGEKDLQVPAHENLEAIKQALRKGGNKNVTTIAYPKLNHLFQECETGLMSEYGRIEQTFSPTVLADITKWINSLLKK